jgi:hypothetical protein
MFIVTYLGTPSVEASLEPLRPNRLAAMATTWRSCKAFDGTSRYEPVPEREPTFGFLQRLLAHTVYNPPVGIAIDWKRTGDCDLNEIIAEVAKGLENDDDGIQQWFGTEDVLKLLRSATSFDEMVDRIECVCGGFEADERLKRIVDAVLSPDPA